MSSNTLCYAVLLLILINETQTCKPARRDPEYRIIDVKIIKKDGQTPSSILFRTSEPFGKDISVPLSLRGRRIGLFKIYTGSIPDEYGSSVRVERLDFLRYENDFLVKITSENTVVCCDTCYERCSYSTQFVW